MITRQQPPEDKEDQGVATLAVADEEDIEITKVIKLRPSSEIRGRPGQLAQKSHHETSGDNSGRRSPQGLRLPVGLRRGENGFGFEYDTTPTGPRAMNRYRDDVHAAGEQQRNQNQNPKQRRARKRRNESPASDRSRNSRTSSMFCRAPSHETHYDTFGPWRYTIADYENPYQKPLPKKNPHKRRNPRDSAKRYYG